MEGTMTKRTDHRVSVTADTLDKLDAYRDRLADRLGFRPTHSQTIDHLLKGTDR